MIINMTLYGAEPPPGSYLPVECTYSSSYESGCGSEGEEIVEKGYLMHEHESSSDAKGINSAADFCGVRTVLESVQGRSLVLKQHSFMRTKITIDGRYRVTQLLGAGSHGVVCAARDDVSGENVALKKIGTIFRSPGRAKRTLRELILLRCLDHPNIVSLKTVLKPVQRAEFHDIYVCTELMETDLAAVIASEQEISNEHIQSFIYQLLKALQYIHAANVSHRDVKPRNILLNQDCSVKLCDFGLARYNHHNVQSSANMTDYVATRWYRAPEVMMRTGNYGKAIDMWAVGCILGELLTREPVFPGNDSTDQVNLIAKSLGRPPEDFLTSIKDKRLSAWAGQLSEIPQQPLRDRYKACHSRAAIDLLEKLLVYDSEKRLTATQALQHDFFTGLHRVEPQSLPVPLPGKLFHFDHRNVSISEYRELVFAEVERHHKDNCGPYSGSCAVRLQRSLQPLGSHCSWEPSSTLKEVTYECL